MLSKKPDSAVIGNDAYFTQPSTQKNQLSYLSFKIEEYDYCDIEEAEEVKESVDGDIGKSVQIGSFSRNWDDEEDLDVLLYELESGRITDKQALAKARKLEKRTPDSLEMQNFIANRLWAQGMRDEASETFERAFNRALAIVPKDYKGQIAWSEVDNRPFLRLAHGTLLGLMHRRDGKSAMTLAKKLLAWSPQDNLGVRFLLGDIALISGNSKAALNEYLTGEAILPAHWYQAGLIAFRDKNHVAACTYLRRGIAANPYIAEGLTGRTLIAEHIYRHINNIHGPQWAIDYLDSPACDWSQEESDFVDWVFNSSAVLKERAELMELNEGLTYERDIEKRNMYARRSMQFAAEIDDAVSKQMVKKVQNRSGAAVWPWERASIR
jgi:tetratricopeptide (TPR) repeat protein